MKTAFGFLFFLFLFSARTQATTSSGKFSISRSENVEEGAWCTKAGWEYTRGRATEFIRHQAKVTCAIKENWDRYEELGMYCDDICSEYWGTLSKCKGWYRCVKD